MAAIEIVTSIKSNIIAVIILKLLLLYLNYQCNF